MKFFVVQGLGNHAVSVKVIRAESAAEAMSLAVSETNLDLFPTLRIQELTPEGGTEVLFETSYVE